MCGIGGRIHLDQQPAKNINDVFHSTLNQRGPENFSVYENENLYLCHARLKIIDLSDTANQPMFSKSRKSCIVYNGEIYNFNSLKNQLPFLSDSHSDTKVLVELFEYYGVDEILPQLEGMFAFCYVNFDKNEVKLGRDRLGQKPLYYYKTDHELIFSSDIRAISKLKEGQLSINFNSITYYLSELSMPQPFTVWNEVRQVMPAYVTSTNLKLDFWEEVSYWKLNVKIKKWNEIDLLTEVEQVLTESILKRTVSDVPIGTFLSGGVDSGLITSILATNSEQPIKTFTVGFDYADFDETNDARLIANKYKTEHTEIRLNVDIESDIETILEQFGEPFADSSAIPTYYISKEIKEHVTVALSGDGGDELFGGYIDYGFQYQADYLINKYPNKLLRKMVTSGSKVASRMLIGIPNYGTALNQSRLKQGEILLRQMGFPLHSQHLDFNNDFIMNYLNDIWKNNEDNSTVINQMKASLQTRLLNDYLVKVDRASMAHSLEVRSPFLDHHLLELAFSIPNELKFRNNESKYVLKKLGEKYMYSDIFSKQKRGFGIPIKHWLKKELFDFAYTHINDLIKRQQYVNSKALDLLIKHKNGQEDNTHRVWAMVCLEIWLKKNTE